MVETGHNGGFGLSAAIPQCSSDFVPHLSYPLITGISIVNTFCSTLRDVMCAEDGRCRVVRSKHGGALGNICRLPWFGGWYTGVTDH
jgi:hypothetical protein